VTSLCRGDQRGPAPVSKSYENDAGDRLTELLEEGVGELLGEAVGEGVSEEVGEGETGRLDDGREVLFGGLTTQFAVRRVSQIAPRIGT
jgi:hypothetical protein